MNNVAKRFFNLSIKQQLFAIIFSLVVAQVTLATNLLLQFNEASVEAKQEQHLKELLGRSQRLMFVMHDYSKAIIQFCNYLTPASESELMKYVDEMQQLDRFILSNIQSYPSLHKKMEAFSRVNDRVAKLTEKLRIEARRIPDHTQRFLFYVAMEKQAYHNYVQWHDRSADILKEEVSLLQRLPARQQHTRSSIRATLIGGVIVSIVAVFIVMLFYVKHICSRLHRLVRNTILMAEHQMPLPPLAGDDELARLDHSMQDMSEAIQFAGRERQAMLATVSHELRTPLNAVSGAIELLADEDSGLSPTSHFVAREADKDTTRLIALITDLLDLEKAEAGELRVEKDRCDLEPIVFGAIKEVYSKATEKEVQIRFHGLRVDVVVNPARMQQVFVALLSNAISASPEKSSVSISIKESGDEVAVEVVDEGPGVPLNLRKNLFDRFRSEHANGGERIIRGMGLPLSSRIVELHGGRLQYRETSGGGATFEVKLPRA